MKTKAIANNKDWTGHYGSMEKVSNGQPGPGMEKVPNLVLTHLYPELTVFGVFLGDPDLGKYRKMNWNAHVNSKG